MPLKRLHIELLPWTRQILTLLQLLKSTMFFLINEFLLYQIFLLDLLPNLLRLLFKVVSIFQFQYIEFLFRLANDFCERSIGKNDLLILVYNRNSFGHCV